ncbi:hypothetical protein [Salegentibacter salarius]|uniref:hypothetical protein n=1 Tax=Salegentibacter salarius TaxID=435906 RepID=UPI001F3D9C94|nr:hypothetical protein [Salegentibacter salarius]
MPLLLLSIWFFTCKHWWYHVILVPVIMYGFQLVTAFYEDAYTDSNIMMDTNQLIYLAPFFIVILSIVYLIRVKIFDRIYGIDLSEIDETDVSVFSPISETDRREVKSFQEEEQYWEPAQEDYYTQL